MNNKFIKIFPHLGLIFVAIMAVSVFIYSKNSVNNLEQAFHNSEQVRSTLVQRQRLEAVLNLSSLGVMLKEEKLLVDSVKVLSKAIEVFDQQSKLNRFSKTQLEEIETIKQDIENLREEMESKQTPSRAKVVKLAKKIQSINRYLAGKEKLAQNQYLKNNKSIISDQISTSWILKLLNIVLLIFLIVAAYFIKRNKEVEKKALEEQRVQSKLLASLSEGVLMCNQNGIVTACNQSASKIIQLPVSEIIGNKMSNLFPVLYSEAGMKIQSQLNPISNATRKAKRLTNNVVGVHFIQQGLRWLSLSSYPLYESQDQTVFSSVFSFSDVTERIENLQIIQKQQAQIVQNSRLSALGEMAGGIAHEINNPLAIIQSQIDDLSDEAEDAEQIESGLVKSITDNIGKTVTRINKIIRGLQGISREGSNDPFESQSLKEVLEVTLDLCTEKFRKAQINLFIETIPEDINLVCRPVQLSQVFLNLMNNAKDAIEELESKWIRLETNVQTKWIEVRISDSGSGIPKDVALNLFQPFFTTKAVGKGTGLGLSISHKIILAHGGTLEVDHDHPNTCFVIRLPYKAVEKQDGAA